MLYPLSYKGHHFVLPADVDRFFRPSRVGYGHYLYQ